MTFLLPPGIKGLTIVAKHSILDVCRIPGKTFLRSKLGVTLEPIVNLRYEIKVLKDSVTEATKATRKVEANSKNRCPRYYFASTCISAHH